MRYPEFLQPGGRVGFIAPSFGCDSEPYKTCFDKALERFAQAGYSCVTGPNCRASAGIGKSNTPQACAGEINDFFINDRSDIIISCGGGETMCEDLSYVDFDAIAGAKPKWYMGYSDNTNLVFTLPTLCDTAAVYGPCAGSFGQSPLHPSLTDAVSLLEGKKLTMSNYSGWEREGFKDAENPLAPYNITEPFSMEVVTPEGSDSAAFSGRLIGGCLDCLQVLCGTRFDRAADFCEKYREDGIIWFIESCDLNPFSIRRALWQLSEAGWFRHVSGFLIGRPMQYGMEMMGLDCREAALGVLRSYGKPILLDVDLGHLPPMMPLIAGAVAEVSAAPGKLSIDMKLA